MGIKGTSYGSTTFNENEGEKQSTTIADWTHTI